MSIVITGPLAFHCGTKLTRKNLYKQYSGVEFFIDSLSAMNIDLEFAKPSQELAKDPRLVLFCGADLRSLGAGFGMQAYYCLLRRWAEGLPSAFYFDDAYTDNFRQGLARFAGRPAAIKSRMRVANQHERDWVEDGASALSSFFEDLLGGHIAIPAIGLQYQWGNPASLGKALGVPISFSVDPTAFYLDRMTPANPDFMGRERRWFLASLRPQAEKWANSLETAWPKTVIVPKKGGLERMPEEEIQQLSKRSWGQLSYPIGSLPDAGVFRVRPLNTAFNGQILYGDASEFGGLGGPYDHSLEYIEALPVLSLKFYAQAQKEHFLANTEGRGSVLTRLHDYLQKLEKGL